MLPVRVGAAGVELALPRGGALCVLEGGIYAVLSVGLFWQGSSLLLCPTLSAVQVLPVLVDYKCRFLKGRGDRGCYK